MSRRHLPEVFLSVGLFGVLVAIFYASPVRTPFDSRWAVHTAMSFARGHWGDLSEYTPILEKEPPYTIEYHKNRPRTVYPIGVSLLSVPPVAAILLVRPVFNEELRYAVPVELESLLAAAFGALIGVFFWRVVFVRFDSHYLALGSTAILCFCTSVWSTASRALWQHTPVVLMFVLAMGLLLGARTRPHLIQYLGLPLAMSFISRPTAAVAVVVFSLYVLIFYRQWFLRYVSWSLLLTVPWVVYNFCVYDFPFPPYYITRYQPPGTLGESLLGNLFSPARGLFIYSPVLLFALPGFVLSLRERRERWLHVAFAAVVVLHWLTVSSAAPVWWGGFSYGPRFMTDMLPFLVYFLAFTFKPLAVGGLRQVAVAGVMVLLAGVSLLMHAQGALNWAPYRWNVDPSSVNSTPSRLWDWRDPQFARGWLIWAQRAPLLNLTGGVVPVDMKPYQSGAAWWFQAGRVDPLVLRSGWSVPEAWGVWSDGSEAHLMLDPKPAFAGTGDLLLIVRATAFTAARHPRQQVEVVVNHVPVALWTYDERDEYLERRARVPAAVVKFPLAISFRLRNPVSPAELGGNADARRLGLGLTGLRLMLAGEER